MQLPFKSFDLNPNRASAAWNRAGLGGAGLLPPMRFAGGSGPEGRPAPSAGGDTWAMNAFAPNSQGEEEFFGGPQGAKFTMSGGDRGLGRGGRSQGSETGLEDAVTGGFGALPALPGRFGYRGSLENVNPDMGTLDNFDAWNATRGSYSGTRRPSPPPVEMPSSNPLLERLKDVLPWMGKGGPVQANAPVVVGDEGPEVFVPKTDGEIIPQNGLYAPTDAARRRRAALKAENIKGYLSSLMV